MLAYAASRPVVVDRRPRPNTMLLIIGVHVAAIATVMSAKMDLPVRIVDPPIKVRLIELPPEPAPIVTKAKRSVEVRAPARVEPPISQPQLPSVDLSLTPTLPPLVTGVVAGAGASVTQILPKPRIVGLTSAPQLVTPESQRRPPYPASKLLNEEEALLTLRLTIDDRGRVVAVAPVGRADPAFLDSARRHLIAHWRYKPAMEDGRAVPSATVIRLRFELNG